MNANSFPTRGQVRDAVAHVRQSTRHQPTIGLILGSGLSPLADGIEGADVLPYTSIPHFPTSTVAGHAGRLVLGTMEGRSVVAMQGRVHFYEGYAIQQVAFPVRVMGLLGVDTLIVTNAAGGLVQRFAAGDLMLIRDHINLIGLAGHNPLIGPNDPDFGPRFPDMAMAYDPALREIARQVAKAQGITLHEGVYVCISGPSFETPTEVQFLRTIGADAVGMSTAHEVIVARHMGLRVMGISGITNVHSFDTSQPQETSHQEVLETGQVIAPRLTALIRGILKQL